MPKRTSTLGKGLKGYSKRLLYFSIETYIIFGLESNGENKFLLIVGLCLESVSELIALNAFNVYIPDNCIVS